MKIDHFYAIGAILFLLGIIAGMAAYSSIAMKKTYYIEIPSRFAVSIPSNPNTDSDFAAFSDVGKGDAFIVAPGEEFILEEGQTAILGEEALNIKITAFVNSPCPKGAQCFWSGQGVEIEYSLNGEVQKGMGLTEAFGYRTTIIDTDYETYADLSIDKIQP